MLKPPLQLKQQFSDAFRNIIEAATTAQPDGLQQALQHAQALFEHSKTVELSSRGLVEQTNLMLEKTQFLETLQRTFQDITAEQQRHILAWVVKNQDEFDLTATNAKDSLVALLSTAARLREYQTFQQLCQLARQESVSLLQHYDQLFSIGITENNWEFLELLDAQPAFFPRNCRDQDALCQLLQILPAQDTPTLPAALKILGLSVSQLPERAEQLLIQKKNLADFRWLSTHPERQLKTASPRQFLDVVQSAFRANASDILLHFAEHETTKLLALLTETNALSALSVIHASQDTLSRIYNVPRFQAALKAAGATQQKAFRLFVFQACETFTTQTYTHRGAAQQLSELLRLHFQLCQDTDTDRHAALLSLLASAAQSQSLETVLMLLEATQQPLQALFKLLPPEQACFLMMKKLPKRLLQQTYATLTPQRQAHFVEHFSELCRDAMEQRLPAMLMFLLDRLDLPEDDYTALRQQLFQDTTQLIRSLGTRDPELFFQVLRRYPTEIDFTSNDFELLQELFQPAQILDLSRFEDDRQLAFLVGCCQLDPTQFEDFGKKMQEVQRRQSTDRTFELLFGAHEPKSSEIKLTTSQFDFAGIHAVLRAINELQIPTTDWPAVLSSQLCRRFCTSGLPFSRTQLLAAATKKTTPTTQRL